MSRWLIALLFVSATAHAAPPELRDDDMNQLLVNRSLISQLREARHHMAERTSDFVKEARQSVAEKTSDLVVTAMGFIGVPYRRGGNSAETGFDCSGFVRAIYSGPWARSCRVALTSRHRPRKNRQERTQARRSGVLQHHAPRLQPRRHLCRRRQLHSCPRTGAQVRVESMQSAYWARRFDGARRVQDSDGLGLDASKAALAMQMQASQLQ